MPCLAFFTVTASPPPRKSRLPRFRAAVKWSGATLCVLLFALWLASGWCGAHLIARPDEDPFGTYHGVEVGSGQILLTYCADPALGQLQWQCDIYRLLPKGFWDFGFSLYHVPPWWTIVFPLWLPFLLIALPTGYLCYRDRKAKPGLCAVCRYDLRGLPETTMKCPECGSLRRTVQADLRSAVQGMRAASPATPPAEEAAPERTP